MKIRQCGDFVRQADNIIQIDCNSFFGVLLYGGSGMKCVMYSNKIMWAEIIQAKNWLSCCFGNSEQQINCVLVKSHIDPNQHVYMTSQLSQNVKHCPLLDPRLAYKSMIAAYNCDSQYFARNVKIINTINTTITISVIPPCSSRNTRVLIPASLL